MAPAIFFHFYLKKVLTYLWGMVIIISDVSNNANANTKRTEDRMEILKSKKESKSVYEITAYRADIDEIFFFTLHRYEVNGWALLDEDGDVLQTFRTKQAAMEWLTAEGMTGIHVGQIH